MRLQKSSIYNYFYWLYRIVSPVMDPIKFIKGIYGYIWFFKDYLLFTEQAGEKVEVGLSYIYPQLHDKTSITDLDSHYFYQQLWLFEKVLKDKPQQHVDFGSTYQMSGYLSKIVKTVFCDIRPIKTDLENLEVRSEDLLKLTYPDGSLTSVSCLHVIEHIGLGRYGDKLDVDGSKKAASELKRVLAVDGKLYVSCPIGIERVYFNAHRVFYPETVIEMFSGLTLEEFSYVDDNGKFIQNSTYQGLENLQYGCGMFIFKKS